MLNKIVLSMATLRMISGSLEIIAALLMLRFNQVEKALIVNSSLALVGPLVLITTTTIGFVGVAEKFSWDKIGWVLLGISLILFGIFKK
ncbi:YqhV family protein [Paenibacillus terrigena]|uniref:YqhV family protein n=1 Tax=Paenibacillus terrigena TaxID=369333 RepID=UPI0028D686B6|nr:YqhV family protein [Paenibacillus terrigena]